MCGFIGIATASGVRPSVDERALCALRDTMTHRGPDDDGFWQGDRVMLGHRRLIVVDTTDHGHQPMHSGPPERRFTIVYNGELYNDDELRADLRAHGVTFGSTCDTETLLEAFARWGEEAFERARGMFACAIYDHARRTLTLARDPLGIKPLYYAFTGDEFVFASEAHAVAAHPKIGKRPDWAMVSAYTTTIRTVLGDRTLYHGVRALRAGQVLRCDLAGDTPELALVETQEGSGGEGAPALVREAIGDSVRVHLRADVPVCALLSGGLDSTITVALAQRHHTALRTYAAGEDQGDGADLSHARRVAETLGTRHAEAIVDRGLFTASWPEMVRAQGMPLSTPNEVAIHAVASRLREDGCVVTLSGEGADELFGGYAQPLGNVVHYLKGETEASTPGAFELASNAWAPVEAKGQLFRDEAWAMVEQDAWLRAFYDEEFERCAAGARTGDTLAERMQPHLRFLRRVNLLGLLQRLDSATMLASVEGRTPFADVRVMRLAESLPGACKYDPGGEPPANTKMVLREAFSDLVPEHVMTRDKASFPLPFTRWMAGHEEAVRTSPLVRALYRPEAISLIASQPERVWNLAWPAINLAHWGHTLEGM